jgi:hypothetical protein
MNKEKLKELIKWRKVFDGQISVADTSDLIDYAQSMENAMTEFVERVDKGEVRSRKTYSKFKDILGI